MSSINKLIGWVYKKDFKSLEQHARAKGTLDLVDEDGRTPLMHAVLDSQGTDEMVRHLLKGGASPNVQDKEQKWSALHFAARDQKVGMVRALLEAGAAVDSKDAFGNTPLWRSIVNGRTDLEVVKALLEFGANPDEANLSGNSPRDMCVRLAKGDVAQIMTRS